MREIKIYISNTGQKKKVESPIINQNSSDNKILLYSETQYTNVTATFKLPNQRTTPDYHMTYQGFDSSTNSYIYEFYIPYALTSFVMPAPTAKIDVSFKCWLDDDSETGYLRTTSVAGTYITVNRSNNSDVLDESYNGVDIQNLWTYVGVLKNEIEALERRVEELEG